MKRYKSLIALGLAAVMTLTNAPMTTLAAEIALDNAAPAVMEVDEPAVRASSGYTVDKTQIGTSGVYWALTSDGTLEITGSGDPSEYMYEEGNDAWLEYEDNYGGIYDTVKTITISDTVRPTDMNYWFEDFTALVNPPAIPDSVEELDSTFEGCTSLKTAPIIPEGVTEYSRTFKGCTALEEAPVTPSTAYWCQSTFQNCTSLKVAPVVPKNVVNTTDMFNGCTSLTGDIQIYGKLIHYENMLAGTAIKSTDNLIYGGTCTYTIASEVEKTAPSGMTLLRNSSGVPVSKIGTSNCYWGISEDGTLVITGNGNPGRFSDRWSIPWRDVRSSIVKIDMDYAVQPTNMDYWFYECDSLTTPPTIPNSVTSLNGTFSVCTSLTTPPVIPEGVENCASMFENCFSLKTAPVIPNSVEDCGYMFRCCTSLKTAPVIPNSVTDCFAMFDGCSLNDNVFVLCNATYTTNMFLSNDSLTLYYAGDCTENTANKMAETGRNITVKNANSTNLSLTNTASVRVGSTTKISYTYDGYDKGHSYKSSNASVATVDNNGTIKAVKPGTATITLTVNNYSSTVTKTCTVTVNDVAPAITSQPTAVSTTPENAVTFKITASGTNNKYQWYMTDNMITDGTVITGATSATYTIPANSVNSDLDGKYFYCVVSNSGNTPVSSALAKLSVVTSPTIPTFKTNITANSWANSSVTMELMGSTINGSTEDVGYKYSVDGGVTWTTYDEPFVWDTDTESATIQAKAYNKNYPTTESEIVKFIIKYDATAPVIKTVAVNDKTITIDAYDETSKVQAYAITETLMETPAWSENDTFEADYGTYYVHVKDNAGNVAVYGEAVTLEKGASQCSVEMSDWTHGEAASEPVITSKTNPTENAVISYYNGETKLTEKPSVPGTYKVVVTLPETATQKEVTATASFTIRKGTLTVSTENYSGKYDGKKHSASVSCNGATIKYGMTEGTYDLNTMPEFDTAGNYTVYYEVSKEHYNTVTGSVSVTLAQISGNITASISDWKYGETPSVPFVESEVYTPEDAVITYAVRGTNAYEAEQPSVPGEYTMKVAFPVSDNLEAAEVKYNFTIHKGVLSVSTADYKGTYDKTAHAPSVLCDGAEVKYGLTAGTYDLEEMPVFTNAGNYTVYYEAAKEHYNTVTGSVNVSIEKAAGTPENKPVSVMTVPYTVKTVGDISLEASDKWEWEIADVALAVGVPYTAVSVYKGEDAGNYTETSANVVITRTACEHPDEMAESHEGLKPTCTEKGYTAYTICTQCGEYTVAKETLNAAGHKWDAGKITKEATASADGVKTFTCSSCKETKTEAVKYVAAPDVTINKDEDETATLIDVVDTGDGTVTVWKNIDNTYKVVYNAPADKNITNCTIPETVIVNGKTYLVTEVANNVFNGCEKLKEVTIGKNVTTIGKNAFRNCKQLETVNIDSESLLIIKEGAFSGCKALKSIVIPVNVKEIGDNAFKNCKKLAAVTMKSKALEIIGDNAFNGCEELKSIVIPKPVKEIGDGAFKNCKKLAKVSMKTTVLSMLSDNVFYNCKALKSIVIPKAVKEIGDNAFRNCYKLKTVSMKSTALTLIDDNAFYGCKTLKSITIPKKVKKIGDSAFYNCKKLKKITVKTTKLTKKNIGADAFKNVPKTAKVKVPKSKVNSYKKIFASKGLSKKAKVTK